MSDEVIEAPGTWTSTCYFDAASAPSVFSGTPTYAFTTHTTVECVVTSPDGTSTTYVYDTDSEMTLEGSGDDRYYACTVPVGVSGTWKADFRGKNGSGTTLASAVEKQQVVDGA